MDSYKTRMLSVKNGADRTRPKAQDQKPSLLGYGQGGPDLKKLTAGGIQLKLPNSTGRFIFLQTLPACLRRPIKSYANWCNSAHKKGPDKWTIKRLCAENRWDLLRPRGYYR